MVEPAVPARLEDLTPAWLTTALRFGGAVRAPTRVAEASLDVIGADRGIGGLVARVRLAYDRPVEGAPASVVAKLASPVPATRMGGRFLRLPEREVRFYLELAPGLPLRTPRCHYAAVAPNGEDFVILMEDLGAATPGDNLGGVDGSRLDAAIDALARLHASRWRDPALEQLEWLPRIDALAGQWQRFFEGVWRQLRDGEHPAARALLDLLPPGIEATGDTLARHGARVYRRLAAASSTLLHGDFRPDNLFFDMPDGAPLAVFDWSNAITGPGVYDVAYLLTNAVPAERRREIEEGVLARYLDALGEGGVPARDLEGARDAYRLAFLEPFMRMTFLLARGFAGHAASRPERVLAQMVRRSAQAALDLDAVTLLEG